MCGRYSLFDEQDNAEIRKIIAEVNHKYPISRYGRERYFRQIQRLF